MPRRNNPEMARSRQVTVAVTPADARRWREEATAMRTSLSALIYARARAGAPLPSPEKLALARELGRIGNNLNQLVKVLHTHGLVPDQVAQVLATVWQIQKTLVTP